MKYLVMAALVAALGGCGNAQRMAAGMTGKGYKTCVDGVTYLQFPSGATVQVDRSGKPVACQ
jgi:hypothetical protein